MEENAVTIDAVLSTMGVEYLVNHFKENGIDVPVFLNLGRGDISDLLPAPQFRLGDRLKFIQSYLTFMADHSLPIDKSFLPDIPVEMSVSEITVSGPSIGTKESERNISNHGGIEPIVSNHSLVDRNKEVQQNSSHETNRKTNIRREPQEEQLKESPNDDINSDGSDYVPPQKENDSSSDFSSWSDDEGGAKKKKVLVDSNSNVLPQVKLNLIGSKRKMTKKADQGIDEMDLETLFNDHPISEAVLKSYSLRGKLSPTERDALTDILVSELLKLTKLPTRAHYEALCDKICALFPTEKPSVWYLPPKSESDLQKVAKGKLFHRVKNVKDFMRKKGALPRKRKSKISNGQTNAREPVNFSADEQAAITWLKRNREPALDVRLYWGKCALPRLKELHRNKTIAITSWHDILKAPASFQLIVDDFKVLPEVDEQYECLRGKEENLIQKWPVFRDKVVEILKEDVQGLNKKDREELLSLVTSEKVNDDSSDFFVLHHMLPVLCKLKGRVKVGDKTFKPTVQESKDAFILHISDSAEFDAVLEERVNRYKKMKATVQPYIVVQEDSNIVRASFVVINKVP